MPVEWECSLNSAAFNFHIRKLQSHFSLILCSPIASVQTSGILISARGHFLFKMAFVIVYCFSKVFFSSQR